MSDDDRRAFDEAMSGVRPLKHEQRVQPTARPSARARMSRGASGMLFETDARAGVTESAGEEIAFHRNCVSRQTLQRLRGGSYSIEAELDLHGLTATEAQFALRSFIVESAARGLGCVRVIHGKGQRSGPDGPVIKGLVQRHLVLWEQVLAYVTALPRDGGHGAIYVLLDRRRA